MPPKTYIAIDLKSFYASVECADRKLNPMTTNLVVANESRTEKTICLAVSPSLKSYGLPGRARLFEVVQKIRDVNRMRQNSAPGRRFTGKSYNSLELKANPALEIDYIVAPPRMARYMEISAQIYGVYLKYVSHEHIHSYSIDEVFIDATPYLKLYRKSAHDFVRMLIQDVLQNTGITATAGIGTNLYLAKIAMDIMAKHIPADKDGVRIAELDEITYRQRLWSHRPLTDFWRVGHGYSSKLEAHGMYSMGDIARMSHVNEDLLYRLFGVNAELLIDHAWGWEPCTIEDIKSFKPENSSLSSGQVLQEPYEFDKARIVVSEMADMLSLDLLEKQLVTDQVTLTVGYEAATDDYNGTMTIDHYGRKIPKSALGSINLKSHTASGRIISEAILNLYDRIVNPKLKIRRLTLGANHVIREDDTEASSTAIQDDFFADSKNDTAEQEELDKEKRLQQAILKVKNKHGKNAILKGMSLLEGATAKERNCQVGGHKA